MSTRLKRSMRTIMMDGARLLMHTALVAALTVPAGAQQGTAPDDTFLAEPVTGKPNLEPALARPAQEKAAGDGCLFAKASNWRHLATRTMRRRSLSAKRANREAESGLRCKSVVR